VPLASNLEPGNRRQLITGARREPNKRRVRRRSSAPETAHTHHQSHSGNTRGTFDPAKVFPAHVQGGDYRAWMIETARLGHRAKGLARTARDSVPELRNELRPRTLERSGDVAVFISQRRPAADGQPPHLLTVERAKLRGLERGVMPPEPAGNTLKGVGLSGRSRAPVTPPPPRGDRITIVERRLWQSRPPSTVMICRSMSPAPMGRS
jgi:hypothetical protein